MIRTINPKDAEEIKNICNIALGYNCTTEEVQRQINILSKNSNQFIRVYVDDNSDKVMGFIEAEVYSVLYYSKDAFNILGLAVNPDCQGKGIGKILMAELEKEAKNRKYGFIRFNSSEKRLDAHKFYENIGYECDKLQKRFIKYL